MAAIHEKRSGGSNAFKSGPGGNNFTEPHPSESVNPFSNPADNCADAFQMKASMIQHRPNSAMATDDVN